MLPKKKDTVIMYHTPPTGGTHIHIELIYSADCLLEKLHVKLFQIVQQ